MIPWTGNDSRNRRSEKETRRRRRRRMEKEDEAGCCARHGTLAPGLESRGPPGTEVHSFIHQSATFLPFLFPSSLSPYFFLFPVPSSSSRLLGRQSTRRSWKDAGSRGKQRRRDYSVAKWQPSRLVPPLFSMLRCLPQSCSSTLRRDSPKF